MTSLSPQAANGGSWPANLLSAPLFSATYPSDIKDPPPAPPHFSYRHPPRGKTHSHPKLHLNAISDIRQVFEHSTCWHKPEHSQAEYRAWQSLLHSAPAKTEHESYNALHWKQGQEDVDPGSGACQLSVQRLLYSFYVAKAIMDAKAHKPYCDRNTLL